MAAEPAISYYRHYADIQPAADSVGEATVQSKQACKTDTVPIVLHPSSLWLLVKLDHMQSI